MQQHQQLSQSNQSSIQPLKISSSNSAINASSSATTAIVNLNSNVNLLANSSSNNEMTNAQLQTQTQAQQQQQLQPTNQSQLPQQQQQQQQSMSSPECHGCFCYIQDRYYLLVMDRPWHIQCLRCADCKLSLDSQQSCFAKDGLIYCKDDYFK